MAKAKRFNVVSLTDMHVPFEDNRDFIEEALEEYTKILNGLEKKE